MGYNQQHVRVAFNGTIGLTERWSTGFSLTVRPNVGVGLVEVVLGLNEIAEGVRSLLGPLWGTGGFAGLFGAVVRLESTTTRLIDEDGRTLANGEYVGAALVGTGTVDHPPQTCMVASLRTLLPGPRGRGRMYWPATGAPMAGDGVHIDAAPVTSLLTGVRNLISQVNGLEPPDGWIGTHEVRVMSAAGDGASSLVTRVEVGNVFDTQRRRTEDLAETYQSAVV